MQCCRVAKVVAPKKEKLAAAESEYGELMTGLNQKKAELAAVESNLAALNAKLKEMQVSFGPSQISDPVKFRTQSNFGPSQILC